MQTFKKFSIKNLITANIILTQFQKVIVYKENLNLLLKGGRRTGSVVEDEDEALRERNISFSSKHLMILETILIWGKENDKKIVV